MTSQPPYGAQGPYITEPPPPFPPELIERCRRVPMRTDIISRTVVEAILRESGHAELVAALRKARDKVDGPEFAELLAEIDAALAAAGVKP